MDIQPILSPEGNAVFTCGGKHAWKTETHKGFNISLEWVAKIGKRKNPPRVLCIWRSGNVLHPNNDGDGIWTISQNGIQFFVGFDKEGKCSGGVSEHGQAEAKKGLAVMGYDETDTSALHALLDVIVRYAPDLMMMPPAPRRVRKDLAGPAMFDMQYSHKDSGKVISEGEI